MDAAYQTDLAGLLPEACAERCETLHELCRRARWVLAKSSELSRARAFDLHAAPRASGKARAGWIDLRAIQPAHKSILMARRHNEEVNARADERAEVDVGAGHHQTGNKKLHVSHSATAQRASISPSRTSIAGRTSIPPRTKKPQRRVHVAQRGASSAETLRFPPYIMQ